MEPTMNRTKCILTLLACCCGALYSFADTIANWQFDDGVPTNNASALVTETNAPTLNATAGRYSSGARYPMFDADRPGARIWANFAGPLLNSTNAASLRFINADLPGNTNSYNGGLATVADSPLLRVTNLTVEVFLKVDRRMNFPLVIGKARSGGTSWNLDFDNTGKPRVRIDSGVAFTNGTPGFNESVTAAVSVEDGQWHHVAFTYTHTNKTARLYIDYVLSASRTTYSNLVYDSSALYIASGAGGRGFDGWIDEIRLTDSVLTPEQFMTVTEPTSTRGYWMFEDGAIGAAANVLTNTFYAPLMNGTAAAIGGAKPTFSAERPPASTARISDGIKGPVVNMNAGSLFFVNAGLPANTNSASGGQVTVNGSTVPAQMTNFTAEAFVKVNRHVNYPQIIGKTRALTGGYSWSLGLNSFGNLRWRIDSQIPPGTSGFNQTLESPAFMEDGKWHHVALTYDYSTRTARLYKDYVKVYNDVATINPLVTDSGDIRIGNGDQAFDGWIDEVRLTDRVLAPSEFLYTVPLAGTVIGVK